jgi:hypothetical protein
MTERREPSGSGRRAARRRTAHARAGGVRGAETLPPPPPTYLPLEGEPTIFGLPADIPEEHDEGRVSEAGPEHSSSAPVLVVLRRADPVGAGALVLAGVAANASLLLSWSPDEGPTGLSLVRRGIEALGAGAVRAGVWEPPVVVLSGGLFILLGLLLLVPARAHRFLGVLALIVSFAAATAVVHLMLGSDLVDDRLGPGMWCAVAVPVLGVLGALKAMLTAPQVTLGADV